MTLHELHQNEELRRREFPVAARDAYFANAAVCPLPKRVGDAIAEYARECTQGNQEDFFSASLYGETRMLTAELLGCQASDIAIVGPTSIGLSLIANGLDYPEGCNVVYAPDDYPSNAVVWMNLEKRGVELRQIKTEEVGRITLEDIERLVDENTRLVAIASAHFVNGYRPDINQIGRYVKSKGALFSVDGIQTLGAFKTPVEHVDFLPADSHKWMLGPVAAGVLYVGPEGRKALEPTLLGWNNVICPNYLTPEKIQYARDARRYEAGSHNLLGLAGLNAALKLLKEMGQDEIEKTVEGHTRRIRKSLREKGYILAGNDDTRLSGITSFRKEGEDMKALFQKLRDGSIYPSLRQTRDGKDWLRFSPHFYNTTEEVDKALSLL